MNSYIFITREGYTYQPNSHSIEPDIKNCQVIGLAKGSDTAEALKNLLYENGYLLDTTFDELICYQLRDTNYHRTSTHFSLNNHKVNQC